MAKHYNNGNCDHCEELFDKYPGFHQGLKDWFKAFQKKVPDAHISCAGRGKVDQEDCFRRGSSNAHYGKSAHNWNAALDIFRMTQDSQLSYDRQWFRDKVGTAVITSNASPDKKFNIEWYGMPGSKYFELPHCQVEHWDSLPDRKLVEEE